MTDLMTIGLLTVTGYCQGSGRVSVRSVEHFSTSRVHVVQEEFDRDSSDVQARGLLARQFGQLCHRNSSRKTNSIGQKKPKLDNVRNLKGIWLVLPVRQEPPCQTQGVMTNEAVLLFVAGGGSRSPNSTSAGLISRAMGA